jgi:hypothetical protein
MHTKGKPIGSYCYSPPLSIGMPTYYCQCNNKMIEMLAIQDPQHKAPFPVPVDQIGSF